MQMARAQTTASVSSIGSSRDGCDDSPPHGGKPIVGGDECLGRHPGGVLVGVRTRYHRGWEGAGGLVAWRALRRGDGGAHHGHTAALRRAAAVG